MPDGKFAAHPLNHTIQITASGQVWQEGFVLLFHGRPVGAVHVWCIEIVAVDSPRFVQDLRPLGSWLDPDFDAINVQLAFPCFRLFCCRNDEEVFTKTVENLLLVSESS